MKNNFCKSLQIPIIFIFSFILLTSLKGDYLNAEDLFGKLETGYSTKTDEDSSVLPTNPFEIVEMIRRQNSLNDATNPSDAIDDALKSFDMIDEKEKL